MKHKDTITNCDVSHDRKHFASSSVDKCVAVSLFDDKLISNQLYAHLSRKCTANNSAVDRLLTESGYSVVPSY